MLFQRFLISHAHRLDYQPLFGKWAHTHPRKDGWTRELTIVSFSQSECRLHTFLHARILHKSDRVETWQPSKQLVIKFWRRLSSIVWDPYSEKRSRSWSVVKAGSGKSLIFQAAPMVFDVDKPTKFQSMAVVISLMLPCERSVASAGETTARRVHGCSDQVEFLKYIGVTDV